MSGENRTEKPTPKRRSEARRKGQVARSAEINGAAVLLAGILTLVVAGPTLLATLEHALAAGLARAATPGLASESGLGVLEAWAGGVFVRTVAPVAVVAAVVALIANIAQVKLKLAPQAARPTLRALDPLPGLKRLFGPHGLVEGVKAIVKTGIVGLVAFLAVWPSIPDLSALVGLPPAALLAKVAAMIAGISLRVAVALAFVAAADYLWQRYRHEKSLRMTKDEVRREARQHDVAPEVRGAIRRRQREQARRRMLAAVPTADVVVTNPTHYAVALAYDGTLPAPQVVAKGADHVAQAIRRVAEEHGVPILASPALARSLYREVELGHMISEGFYAAVAEVLAFVWRTAGRRRPAGGARGAVRPPLRQLKTPSAQAITGP